MEYSYSYPDFINYCSESGNKIRAEEEIIWYNRIPMPRLLVRKIFFHSPKYFEIYIDHLLSAIIISLSDQKSGSKDFDELPNNNVSSETISRLKTNFDDTLREEHFLKFQSEIIAGVGIDYNKITWDKFLKTIHHKGKKYNRLYFPDLIKDSISIHFSRCLNYLTRSSTDFFGNVLSDELDIYRNSFSDSFANIFNKLLDFKFEKFSGFDPNNASHGQTNYSQIDRIGQIIETENLQGNLWDPELVQGGKISVEINKHHPIYEVEEAKRFNYLLMALSNEELFISNPNTKDEFEKFRYRVSRQLKEIIKLREID